MRRIKIIIISLLLLGSCSSSIMTLKYEMTPRPYYVNFYYEKTSMKSITGYKLRIDKVNTQEATTELFSSLFHSFDEKDEKNLKASIVKSINASKPFKKIYWAKSKFDMKSKASDIDISIFFVGSTFSRGKNSNFIVQLIHYVVITDKKNEDEISNEMIHVNESSILSAGTAKNNAIEATIDEIINLISHVQQ